MRLILALCLAFIFAPLARAQSAPVVLEPRDCTLLAGLTAGSDRNSSAIPIHRYGKASVLVIWTSLTGSVDATAKVQVSTTPGPPTSGQWVDKTSATFTLSGASGLNMIAIDNLDEAWMRLVFTHNSVSGGTVTAYCNAKGL